MHLTNTDFNYGFVAKCFHWLTAALFIGSYVTVYLKDWLADTFGVEGGPVIHIHFAIGVTVGGLVLLRILWRLTNTTPREEPGNKLMHLAAHLGHLALYGIMIIMPLTGYMGTGADTQFFGFFTVPKFEDTWLFEVLVSNGMGLTFKEFEAPVDFIHKQIMGEWLVWMLIAGHVAAALYHHFIQKDRTLKKMTSGKP
ncbi:cytochrome b [Salinimonas lutimaris]|uniref:cytochrome b n=1 Tax=Salinimonas lutimaris TaxID=914153 RepID=UPI0010C11CBB|nr:cytochrome b [Salinimonas lutimaris]